MQPFIRHGSEGAVPTLGEERFGIADCCSHAICSRGLLGTRETIYGVFEGFPIAMLILVRNTPEPFLLVNIEVPVISVAPL